MSVALIAPLPISAAHAQSLAAQAQSSGMELAAVVMALQLLALVYTGVTFVRAWRSDAPVAAPSLPAWLDLLTPALSIIGLGVAGYLTYVETQAVPAVCGPVGDCNAVQTSSYATLFGVLRWDCWRGRLRGDLGRLAVGTLSFGSPGRLCASGDLGDDGVWRAVFGLSDFSGTVCHPRRVHVVPDFSRHHGVADVAVHASRACVVCTRAGRRLISPLANVRQGSNGRWPHLTVS